MTRRDPLPFRSDVPAPVFPNHVLYHETPTCPAGTWLHTVNSVRSGLVRLARELVELGAAGVFAIAGRVEPEARLPDDVTRYDVGLAAGPAARWGAASTPSWPARPRTCAWRWTGSPRTVGPGLNTRDLLPATSPRPVPPATTTT
ncbi:hypothetical protein GCM10012275_47740 [Longimycelium tulufanense]|uniref:Uncharacterized protein n=1 Tax=Longimycelium tulufanense TaxID=907463 RepID=A0A8J3CBY4_9PSEU|nr:hypothetical protein GCM10012275_47740 [Longimycelium tulufanense]